MKEVKYIPGDLVMYQGKVTTVRECRDNYYVLNCQHSIEDAVYYTDLKPVQLTPKILKKNGWGKDYCIGNEDRYTKYDFLYISYYRNDNTTKLFVKGLTLLSNIKYVHQLQHLLFGLGLSMDLKV